MPTQIAELNKRLNDEELKNQTVFLKSKPQRIVFEVTNRCNLRCHMCGQSHRKFIGVDMSLDTFEKTEPFWQTAYDISLFGWGEPLVNPLLGSFFNKIIEYHPRVFILTNSMLLNDDLIENFVRKDLAFLNFSVDGARASTYNKIRRGSDFNTVIGNIKKVVQMRRVLEKKSPYLRMVFVGMKQNIEEFPDFVELASELGMDEAKMVHMIAYGEKMKDQILYYHKELTNRILDEAKKRVLELNIKLTIPDNFDLNDKNNNIYNSKKHKLCPRPWEELFVQSDGKIRLCMLCKEIMGDLNNESINSIWNNERFQFFRKEINSDNPPSTCAHCPQYKEMNVNDLNAFIQIETELPGTLEVDTRA